MRQRLAIGACALIVALDWMQPLLLDWRPKFVGALLGGLLYLVAALGIARGVRVLALVVAAVPVVPLSTLALWAAGVSLPVQPDGPMLVVLSVQLVAAVAAGRWWASTPEPSGNRGETGAG